MPHKPQFLARALPGIALLLIFFSAAMTMTPSPANATGKSVNITAYCNATYRASGRGPTWKAKYYRNKEQWWCEQGYIVGPQFQGGQKKVVYPEEVCLWAHNTELVHTHRGLNYGIESNMHCGLHSGLMPPEAEMIQTSIRICNRAAKSIRYGIGYHDWRRQNGEPGIVAKGWWGLKSGDCKTFKMSANQDWTSYRGDFFVFGFNWSGYFPFKDVEICTQGKSGFAIRRATSNQCLGEGLKLVGAKHLTLRPGQNSYTFNFADGG